MEHFEGFAVIDLETTGLNFSKNDKIIQIAIIHLTPDGEYEREWVTYVNPKRKMSATHIHGLTYKDVKNSPTFNEIADTVLEKIKNRIIVAHNYKFDGNFLATEFEKTGKPFNAEKHPHFCTRENAIHFLPNILNHTLKASMKEYGITFTGEHHDALNDAKAAAELFKNFLNDNKQQVYKLLNMDNS